MANATVVFNAQAPNLKLYLEGGALKHVWEAHDVGVGDSNPPDGDAYGHLCKIPPGNGYVLGAPQFCGPNSDDGQAYGWWFTPINDNPEGTLAAHGRAGLGIHGGGTGSPEPFAPWQGAWVWTLGCIRMRNEDNGMEVPAEGTLVDAIQFIQKSGGTVTLNVDQWT